jgi:cytochrome P450
MPAEDILSRLKLCQACFIEAMRLCGPAGLVATETVDKTTTLVLKSGTLIRPTDKLWIPFDTLKYNELVFPDPMSFNPHRWLISDQIALAKMDQYNLSFGYGPRICPGIQVAMVEGPFLIAHLVHKLDFRLACPPEEIFRIFALTITPNKMPILLNTRVK